MDTGRTAKRIVERFLVTSSRLGDEAAQTELVNRFQDRFLRHAYRLLGDADQAREAVQDGWLEILRGLPKLKDDGAFTVWAFRIITRRCARVIAGLQKTRRIRDAVLQEAVPILADAPSTSSAERRALHAAMADLPNGHRAAVAMFYLEELGVAEVAVALAIPVGTVKSRLMHARQKLRDALEGEDHGQAG